MIEKLNKIVDSISECFLYAFTYVSFAHLFGWALHTIGVIATSIICFIVVHKFKKWYERFDK